MFRHAAPTGMNLLAPDPVAQPEMRDVWACIIRVLSLEQSVQNSFNLHNDLLMSFVIMPPRAKIFFELLEQNLRIVCSGFKLIVDELLDNLRELSSGSCIPPEFIAKRCRKLQVIQCVNISSWTVEGIAKVASSCTQIKEAKLNGCTSLNDTKLKELVRNCTRLQSLDIGKTTVTNQGLYEIALLRPGLWHLCLSRTGADDDALGAIAQSCTMLSTLDIQDEALVGLRPLAHRLTELDAASTNLTGKAFGDVGEWGNLVTLSLAETEITKNFLGVADNFPRLKKISLSATEITNRELQQFLNICYEVEEVDVSHCENLKEITQPNRYNTSRGSSAGLKGAASLRRVNLGFTPLDGGSISGLLRARCSELVELNLSSCINVDDTVVRVISSVSSRIQMLNLEFCEQVTDEGVLQLSGCTRLRHLSLEGLCLIGDDSVIHVVKHCKKLESLRLAGCDDLGDAVIQTVVDSCQRIRLLDVRFCEKITHHALHVIRRRMPSCKLIVS